MLLPGDSILRVLGLGVILYIIVSVVGDALSKPSKVREDIQLREANKELGRSHGLLEARYIIRMDTILNKADRERLDEELSDKMRISMHKTDSIMQQIKKKEE